MTAPSRGTRMFAAALTLLTLTSACGLKSGATDALKSPTGAAGTTGGTVAGGAAAAGTGNVGTGATGSVGGSTTGAGSVVASGPSGGGAAPVSSSGGGGATVANGGGNSTQHSGVKPAASGSCGVPSGGDTTGLTAKSLNIGLHAPLTGTGTPFPNSSFQKGSGVFWQQPGHTVCGRTVNVEFQDDTYTPAGARNVCSQMAKRDFIVVGGGGTDQIQACATDPDIQRLGVPYLSAGVTDNGLTSLSNYFAVSLTYAQQGQLVLDNAKAHGFSNPTPSKVPSDNIKGKNAEWAIVTGSSPNFAGARDGIEKALTAAGIPYKNYPVDQNGNYQPAATQFGQQLALNGFSTIFVDAAPGYFVFMTGGYYGAHVGQANWVGPGVTYTEVTVAQYICTSSKGAVNGHAWFLSPAPGLDHATDAFKRAYNGKYDDIEWALWGLSETLWHLLLNADGNLTRQNFIASTEAAKLPAGSVYPPVDFADHGGHFGGTGAWVQRVNCNATEPDQNQPGGWDTIGNTWLNLF